jgi:hypothetical protein
MIDSTGFASAWIVIHLLGFVASIMVRMHLGGRFEGLLQAGFLVSLTAIGLTTVVGYHDCWQMWPVSAVTLAVMIVLSVVDFGTTRSVPANHVL